MEQVFAMLLAAAALLVRVGQAVGAMGDARAKSVASSGFRNLADLCIATLFFWAIGAAILFQSSSPILGIHREYLVGWSGISEKWFPALVLILIATGNLGPAVAERSRLIVPLALGALLSGLLVPMVLNWVRYGWLSQQNFIDDAGAAAIHLTPAVCAATAALFVGPRDGKYNRDGSSNMIPGHSVLMMLFSLVLTIVGWIPYVLSTVSSERFAAVAANVMIATAAGGLVSLIIGYLRYGKSDILLTCSGVMGGLVSITAAASRVGTPSAFAIGLIAGIIVPWLMVVIDLRWKIDDPGGVIAIHGVGGVSALLAAAIFPAAKVADHRNWLLAQVIGILVVSITTLATTGLLMTILRSTVGIRSKDTDEYDGLDLAEHDINAHPDFQQTMIKSYHLREA